MFQVACVGIIPNERQEVLITKRGVSPFKNQYVMPGGKLDKGESVYECVSREVFEEVGIKINSSELFNIYEVFLPLKQYLILYFLCDVSEYNITIDYNEVTDTVWVDKNNYKNFDITEGTYYILSKFFRTGEFDNKRGIKDFRNLI